MEICKMLQWFVAFWMELQWNQNNDNNRLIISATWAWFECWLYYETPFMNEMIHSLCFEHLPLIIFTHAYNVVVSTVLLSQAWASHLTDYDGDYLSRSCLFTLNLANHSTSPSIRDCLTSISICCLSCQYSCRCFSLIRSEANRRSCVGNWNIFST